MSRCVIHGDMIYLSGLSAAGDDAAAQLRVVLGLVDGYLARAGSTRSKILAVQLWLADMAQFAAMNEVWNAWVDPHCPPSRACVQAALAQPGALVEVVVMATR